jgi:hypothetical protein
MTSGLRMFNRGPGSTGDGDLALVAARTPAALCWIRLDLASAARGGRCPAVLIRVDEGSRLTRLAHLLLLPLARARVERQLARFGGGFSGYAVAPTCDAPMWVYQVDSAAAAYAHSHLMPRGAGWGALRAAIRWWTGCDPAVAGLLLVGVADGD